MFHKHLIIRAEISNPPTDAEDIADRWMKKLIRDIDMKILMGPYAVYCEVPGNRGLTAAAIIETSHIVLHTWDEGQGMLQLDVYTCGFLDPYDVINSLNEFEPTKIEMKYLDRENGLIELPVPENGEIN